MCKKAKKDKDININQETLRMTRVQAITGIIGGVIAFCAFVLSIISLCYSKNIVNYQIEQEQMPKVVVLNHEFSCSFDVKRDSEIIDYSSINDMCIHLYNVGLGVAQNCSVVWDVSSISDACFDAKNNLNNPLLIKEYDRSKEKLPSLTIYQYLFECKENQLKSIWLYDKSSSDIKQIDVVSGMKDISYFLPLTEQESYVTLEVPKPIGIMLLEYATNKIEKPILLYLEITYKDSMGEEYKERFGIKFSVEQTKVIESETDFNVEKIEFNVDIVADKVNL